MKEQTKNTGGESVVKVATSGSGSTVPEGRTPHSAQANRLKGAMGSRRGVKFRSTSDVLRHHAKAHPRLRAGANSPPRTIETGARNGQRPGRKPTPETKFRPHCGLNLNVINAALWLIHGS